MPSPLSGRCTCTAVALDLDCPVHHEQVTALVVQAIDSGRVIQAQPPGKCELCGAVEETRPYGPQGEEVCFSCGMQDEEAAKRQFAARMGWDDAQGQKQGPEVSD